MRERADAEEPVTMVSSWRARHGREEEFGHVAQDVAAAAARFPGNLGATVIHHEQSRDFHTVVQFSDRSHLERWLDSGERARWLAEVGPLAEAWTSQQQRTGLETWFQVPTRATATMKPPPLEDVARLARRRVPAGSGVPGFRRADGVVVAARRQGRTVPAGAADVDDVRDHARSHPRASPLAVGVLRRCPPRPSRRVTVSEDTVALGGRSCTRCGYRGSYLVERTGIAPPHGASPPRLLRLPRHPVGIALEQEGPDPAWSAFVERLETSDP